MPDILSIILLAFVALLIIGPRRLPESLEALWLALTDYQRTQRGEIPLGSLYNARRYWVSEKNSFYALIQVLYRVTEHLEELRRRLFVVVATFAIAFIIAFAFAQTLLGYVLRPIDILNLTPTTTGGVVNQYVIASPVQIQSQVLTPSGTITATVTIPAGTELPLSLATISPVAFHPTEIFTTYIQIAMLTAFGISLPVILFEVLLFVRGPKNKFAKMNTKEWQLVSTQLSGQELVIAEQSRKDVYEGLTAREMRPLYVLTPLAALFFLSGVLFTYFVILPNALNFLFGLGGDLVQPLPSLDDYISFALSLIFWVGLAFETPLVMYFLARLNIVSAAMMARQWRYAVVIIAVVAAVITPTVDAFNMSLVALPMLGLYIIGLIFAKFA